jgi:hypothetical protein
MTLNRISRLALAEQPRSADGVSRRTFLRAAAAAGGGLMLSLRRAGDVENRLGFHVGQLGG